jgi:hypothetical protein
MAPHVNRSGCEGSFVAVTAAPSRPGRRNRVPHPVPGDLRHVPAGAGCPGLLHERLRLGSAELDAPVHRSGQLPAHALGYRHGATPSPSPTRTGVEISVNVRVLFSNVQKPGSFQDPSGDGWIPRTPTRLRPASRTATACMRDDLRFQAVAVEVVFPAEVEQHPRLCHPVDPLVVHHGHLHRLVQRQCPGPTARWVPTVERFGDHLAEGNELFRRQSCCRLAAQRFSEGREFFGRNSQFSRENRCLLRSHAVVSRHYPATVLNKPPGFSSAEAADGAR